MNRILIWLVLGYLVYRLIQQQKALQQTNARMAVVEQSLRATITNTELDYRLQNVSTGTVTQTDLTPYDYKNAFLNYN